MLAKAFDSAIVALSDLYVRTNAKKFRSPGPHANEIYDTLMFAYQLRRIPDPDFIGNGININANDQRVSLLAAKMLATYRDTYSDKQSPVTVVYSVIFKNLFRSCYLLNLKEDDIKGELQRLHPDENDYQIAVAGYSQFRDYLDSECPGFTDFLFSDEELKSNVVLIEEPSSADVLAAYAAVAHQVYKKQILPQFKMHVDNNTCHYTQKALEHAALVFMQEMIGLQKGGFYESDASGMINPTDFPRMLALVMFKTNTHISGTPVAELTKPYQLSNTRGATENIWVEVNKLMKKIAEQMNLATDLASIRKQMTEACDNKYDFKTMAPVYTQPKVNMFV